MIHIKEKKECCGCNACVQRCPKQCITMQQDNEGFLYPVVDTATCIDCGLCEKVCPIINQCTPRKPLEVYAAYNNKEEIRLQSSSGGIFTLLAEETIKRDGVVFGVKFNEHWMPEFGYTEAIEGIAPFRGSKYTQAIVGNAYKKAEEFLKAGREVLFSGTPCQIAGLKRFLRKEYVNLLAVDIICHGVPSPKVWSMYLREIYSKLLRDSADEKKQPVLPNGDSDKSCIEAISFRSKITGWKKYSFNIKLYFPNCNGKNTVVFSETLEKNSFMRAFLNNTILRPSCYACPTKEGKSWSDITIADFWGIEVLDPAFDDDKGCGLIFLNTEKGQAIYKRLDLVSKEKSFEEAIRYNSAHNHCPHPHPNRTEFFIGIDKADNISSYINIMQKPTLYTRIKNRVKGYTKAIKRKFRIIE